MRRFYHEVVGWESSEVDMGGYSDFNMIASSNGEIVAGICHARGPNAELPPQWLVYIVVRDVDHGARRCVDLGGRIVAGPRNAGSNGRYCVIQDPAGAVAALYKPPTP